MSLSDHSGTRHGATPEPIDPAVIEALRELGGAEDPGLLVELIDLYLQDAPQRMAEIEQSLASGDWKLLERAAHTLKSASANIGALALSEVCRELECQARRRDPQHCTSLYERSVEDLALVASALRKLRS